MKQGRPLVSVTSISLVTALAVGGVTFWLAYDGGTYGFPSRARLAVAVWWALALCVSLGVWPLVRPAWQTVAAAALLAGFAFWTLASVAWSADAEGAYAEFNRVALYLGVFLFVLAACRRANIGGWCDGLGFAIAATAVVGLASRFFPHLFSTHKLGFFIPDSRTRLSFPVGYWNGLAIFVALAVPLLLRTALVGRSVVLRALAIAPVPAIGAVVYLASSRGGVVAAVVGVLAMLALSHRRWNLSAALVLAGVGTVVAVAVLHARRQLVNGPLGTKLVEHQGRSAAVLILIVCLGTGIAYGLTSLVRMRTPSAGFGRALAGTVAVLAIAGIALSHPIRRLDAFKQPPSQVSYKNATFAQTHLLSGNGSGRWQFWSAALQEWKDKPLTGHGAGSFESWWAQHGPIQYFIRDAHSLYLETLGELGLVGLVLLLGAFLAVLVPAGRRLARTHDAERVTLAALAATFLAYAVGAGIDWMWELTIVSIVAFACLALLATAALGGGTAPVAEPAARNRVVRALPRAGFAVIAVLFVLAQGLPLLTSIRLDDSKAAVQRGDGNAAISAALKARNLEPWAATPYLQLALVAEQRGDLKSARDWILKATDRSSRDWRLWLVRARIQTKLGNIAAARTSLRRAAQLNPRSPLFRRFQH